MSSIVTFAYLRSLRKSRDMARYPMASPRLFRKKRSSLLRLRMHEFRYPQPTSQGFVGNFSSSLQTKGRCEKNLALQFARAIFHNRLPRPERIPYSSLAQSFTIACLVPSAYRASKLRQKPVDHSQVCVVIVFQEPAVRIARENNQLLIRRSQRVE